MSQKPKIALQRTDDFQEVDVLLSEAMAALDDRNAQVTALLHAEADTSVANPELPFTEMETEETAPAVSGSEESAPPEA